MPRAIAGVVAELDTHDEFYAPTGLQHPSYLLAHPINES